MKNEFDLIFQIRGPFKKASLKNFEVVMRGMPVLVVLQKLPSDDIGATVSLQEPSEATLEECAQSLSDRKIRVSGM